MLTPPPSPLPPRTHRPSRDLHADRHYDADSHLAVSRSSSPSPSSSSSRSSSPAHAHTPSTIPAPPPHSTATQALAKKRRKARRTRWSILLVPAVLILITLSTRALAHPAVLDIFSPDCTADTWRACAESLLDWRTHERHSPSKRAPQDSGSGSGAGSSSIISFPSQSTIALPSTASTTSAPSSSSSLPPSSTTLPVIPTSPPVLPTPFPQPFDSDLGQNFTTAGCETFFLNMTQTDPFRTCRPFSLLLETSDAFIQQAQTNSTLLTAIVWGTCNTDPSVAQCVANMGWFAQELQAVCADDLKARNVQATQALIGLQAYSLMRTVACLPDSTSGAYCYVAAASSTSSDPFFYQLPLGIPFPNASTTPAPSCGACTQDVMAEYTAQGLNLTTLRETYADAAVAADRACGPGYVAEEDVQTGAARGTRVGESMIWTMVAVVIVIVAAGIGEPW